MAATRLIALHVNKGKTVAQCLSDRTDYSENEKKTENGKHISSYECDPKTCDREFLLTKREYLHIHGFDYKRNVIAYQIRQSFKPLSTRKASMQPRQRVRWFRWCNSPTESPPACLKGRFPLHKESSLLPKPGEPSVFRAHCIHCHRFHLEEYPPKSSYT